MGLLPYPTAASDDSGHMLELGKHGNRQTAKVLNDERSMYGTLMVEGIISGRPNKKIHPAAAAAAVMYW